MAKQKAEEKTGGQPESKSVFFAGTLKPGHPTGVYHRAGYVFHRSEPTYIEAGNMTAALEHDLWLLWDRAPVEIEPDVTRNT